MLTLILAQTVDSNTDSNHNITVSLLDMLSNHISIVHLNIESIVRKGIWSGARHAYDVLIIIESWLKPDILDATVHIKKFSQPFRNDRRNRLGGDNLAFVHETITCKRRHNLEINDREYIWLEHFINSKKVLVAGI